MDAHEVTNYEFKKFVQETGYITVAEKHIDWNDLKKQLPPNTPNQMMNNLNQALWFLWHLKLQEISLTIPNGGIG